MKKGDYPAKFMKSTLCQNWDENSYKTDQVGVYSKERPDSPPTILSQSSLMQVENDKKIIVQSRKNGGNEYFGFKDKCRGRTSK